MKIPGGRLRVIIDPLHLTGSLNVTGGSVVQFFDGASYVPNREGTLSSPILIEHLVKAVDPDTGLEVTDEMSTTFYENGVPISATTDGYELLDTGELKVMKNIEPGKAVEIKAITKFRDSRDDNVYERIDTVTLRTILKSEAPYQLNLSQRGVVYFDAYRNPNVTTTVSAELKKGSEVIADFTGLTVKWLNSAGLDCVENEPYADSYSADMKTITIDKTYIDNEHIKCEVWKGEELIAYDTVTFVRKFNAYDVNVHIIGAPVRSWTKELTCTVEIIDSIGNVDADAAFLIIWYVQEDGIQREIGKGATITIPVSAINLKAKDLRILPDIKRREAYAVLTLDDGETVIMDDNDNVLTVETYGV